MASISRDDNGRRTIQFVSGDGKRKSIRLGKVSQREAEETKLRIERLVTAQTANVSVDGETARWLGQIGESLVRKLVKAGLMTPRQTGTATLGQWLKDYREHRADVSKGTSANYLIVANRLLAFFPADPLLHTITEAD